MGSGEKTPRKETDSEVFAKRHEGRQINGNHESVKKDSKSSPFSTPNKESDTDSEPMINMINRHEKREINGNHKSGKKRSESSQFSTRRKESESDSNVISKRYEEHEINGDRESGKKDAKSLSFSTPSKESNSKVIAKTHEKRELKGNLSNALKTIRRNDEISKNFPNEAKNQYKLLQKLKRKERQIRIEADMKGELMPYFRARQITRQHYKDILKTCMKRALLMEEISSVEIREMIRNHVKKLREK